MKTLPWYGAIAVVIGLAATTSGQSEFSDGSSSSSYVQTSQLIGRKVKSFEGKDIGVIKDFVIDRSNGYMAYTVLSTGGEGTGVNTGGGKLVALPWGLYSGTSDQNVLTVKVDRDKIYNAPAFDYTRMDEYARPDYMNNVYSYYGVSPGPRTPVSVPRGGTTGTDVTGTAGPTASPGDVATSTATGTGSQNKKSSAPPRAFDRAARTNSSPKPIPGARGISTRSPISRGETASSTTTPASENATSPSENKKLRRKAVEDTAIRTPSATPRSADGQD